MRIWLPTALVSAIALVLACATPAFADSSESSNWAGYAIHRPGVSFTTVLGTWKQPRATCTPGIPSYSAMWVGLGGYSTSSNALEQIGTEVDCTRTGRVASSAWYELVPAASQTLELIVRPGDELSASVTVLGHKVQMAINDLTRHRRFAKTFETSDIDVSSAEWILEAPSSCFSGQSCVTLPLADFGSAAFGSAGATSTTGHRGSIANRDWNTTKITLAPSARHFIDSRGAGADTGAAAPSAVSANGRGFAVTYHAVSVPGSPTTFAKVSRQAIPRAGQIVHVGR